MDTDRGTANVERVGQAIEAQRAELADAVIARQWELNPELEARYGASGRAKCLQDTHYHLAFLSEALLASRPVLFANYVAWAKELLVGLGVPESDLVRNLELLSEVLTHELTADVSAIACTYVQAGLAQLSALPSASAPSATPSFVADAGETADLARAYLAALLRGDRQAASRMILDAAAQGLNVRGIYLQVFQPCQREIGRLWQTNRISVAEEHYCTAATQFIMSQLYPYVFGGVRQGRTLVATSVGGELHEIGVRMVADFFEMAGWDTFYLGANTPTSSILRTLQERKADVLGVSATMTYHVADVRRLVRAVRESASGPRVKILVGGYPFNLVPDLWQQVGADGWTRDAGTAVELAESLLQGSSVA